MHNNRLSQLYGAIFDIPTILHENAEYALQDTAGGQTQELACDLLFCTPSYRARRAGRPVTTYTDQLLWRRMSL